MTPPTGSPGGQPGWTPGGPQPTPPFSSQPTPPYGSHDRYGGRAPSRLSGFPLFCLGCAGVAVLAFIALIGYGMVQARKIMGPPVTQATLHTVLPPGVPLYPRFTLVEKGSRQMKIPVPGSGGRAAPQMTMLTFTCPDPISVVGPWYGQALAPQGWTGGPSPQEPKQYLLRRGSTTIVLQESKQRRQQFITMMIASDPSPPAGSSPPATFPPPGP